MSHSDGLFDLPDYGFQEELLSLHPVAREIDSEVTLPVARVLPDMPQPHMDRLFDYEIPVKMAAAEVGSRVVIDIGSQRVDGFIVERTQSTNYHKLRPLRRVVSPIGVLTPEVLELCRTVARRQANPVSSAVRLAVPQRHARAEKEFFELPPPTEGQTRHHDGANWDRYVGGPEFTAQIRAKQRPNGVVQLRASDRAPHLLPFLLASVREADQGAIVVVPTPAMARQLARTLSEQMGEQVALFVSEDDHPTRYQTFLGVLTGRSRIVVGTRSAVWAPVQNLGLVSIIDDHHSAFTEPRSPYVHAREVLSLRAAQTGASFVAFNYGPSPDLAAMVARGAARWITPAPSSHRDGVPQILSANDFRTEGVDLARMPSSVFQITRTGLDHGPVLFIVPRAGYIPMLACQNCREIAECPQCAGALGIPQSDSPPVCTRCSFVVRKFRCLNCRGTRLRAVRIGSQRTAQEIGRAFKGEKIHLAGIGEQRSHLDGSRRIVVSTPGVAPIVEGGYSAGVILDAGYMLRSTRLESETHFLRTVAHTAALVRARSVGGKLLIVGDVPNELISVLHTWDLASWSEHLLSERALIGLPPTTVWVELKAPETSLREYLGLLRTVAHEHGYDTDDVPVDALFAGGAQDIIPGMAVLGPNPAGDEVVTYLRFSESDRVAKTAVVYAAARTASAHRSARGLRIVVDPEL